LKSPVSNDAAAKRKSPRKGQETGRSRKEKEIWGASLLHKLGNETGRLTSKKKSPQQCSRRKNGGYKSRVEKMLGRFIFSHDLGVIKKDL